MIRYNLKKFTSTGLSIGIAHFIRRPYKICHEDVIDIVARADKALYPAKNCDKNQSYFD
jgi:hypothetical protein